VDLKLGENTTIVIHKMKLIDRYFSPTMRLRKNNLAKF
jgi:hypothetical protein